MVTILLNDRPRSLKEWQSVELFASAARTKATDEATTGSAIYIGDWDKLQIVHDITAKATSDATTDTYAVTVEMSMDNLAWYSVGAFTVLEGDEAATREIMTFVPGGKAENPNALVIGSTAAAAAVIRQHLVGRWIRYTIVIADNDTDLSMTASLMAMVYRNDIVRVQEDEIKTVELYSLTGRTNENVSSPSAIWEIGDNWEWMQAVLRVTAAATDSGDKLDVYVDLSVDGVDWVNVGQFTQVDGDDTVTTWVELMTFVPGLQDNVDATIVVTSDAGELVTRPSFVGPFLRARAVITESGTDDEEFTFALHAYIKPGQFVRFIPVQ
jgi:hypothetical protein